MASLLLDLAAEGADEKGLIDRIARECGIPQHDGAVMREGLAMMVGELEDLELLVRPGHVAGRPREDGHEGVKRSYIPVLD